jgi:uncharacterized alkaline shock family protein YloU
MIRTKRRYRMTSEARRQDNQQTTERNLGTTPLETQNTSGVEGTTEIDDEVIASIVGYAARQVEGVVRLGASGLIQSVAGRIESESTSYARGIRVEAGRREAIFDIELVVEYGHPIPTIVEDLRRRVSNEVREQTGLTAKGINLRIIGIQFERQREEASERPRVE